MPVELSLPEDDIALAPSMESKLDAEPSLDFDFNIDDQIGQSASSEAPVTPGVPELDLGGLSFDLDEAPTIAANRDEEVTAGGDQWHEVSTKLDLAKAYVEMGDKEGAREILQEVVQDGDNQQQSDAKTLLAELD